MAREQQAHEKLDVFRLSRELALDLYRATAKFPRDERFGLTSQIRRAAVAIPANIAEGAARRSKREFSRFLLTARGSATELRLLLDIAHETGSLCEGEFQKCEQKLDRIFAMTSGLIRRSDAT
ncbi:MAG TPA: four helix bundle protein [Thermoanaerobaculia bacterium]|nr:four helix bundle protein [Thermoanaerobaculia bacterium]